MARKITLLLIVCVACVGFNNLIPAAGLFLID